MSKMINIAREMAAGVFAITVAVGCYDLGRSGSSPAQPTDAKQQHSEPATDTAGQMFIIVVLLLFCWALRKSEGWNLYGGPYCRGLGIQPRGGHDINLLLRPTFLHSQNRLL